MLRPWPPSSTPQTTPTVTRARDPVRDAASPVPLEQIPAWRELVPVMDPALTTPAAPAGMEALLGGLNPDQLRAVTHGDGPLLVVAGAGTGKTQVITRRIAWLIATRRAKPSEILALTFTDKAADEMAVRVDQLVPVRLHGHADRHVPRLRRPADPRVRARARPAARRPRPVARRGRRSSCASTCTSSSSTPTGRSATRPASCRRSGDAVQPLQGRGHHARRPTSRTPTGVAAEAAALRSVAERRAGDGTDRDAADAAAEEAAPPGRAGPAPTAATRTCSPRTASSTSATRSRSRCGSSASRRRRGRRSPAASGTSSSTSSRTRTGPRRELVGLLAEPHRNVTVVGDDDQAIYAFRGRGRSTTSSTSRRATRARGPSSCAATTGRSRPILDASYRLVRFNDPDRLEVRTGIVQAAAAGAPRPGAPRRSASRRSRRGSEEADWIAADIAPADRRRRRAARPRRPRPGERPRRPDPAGAQRGRRPVAVLRVVRPVRAARGPPADGVPADHRRSRSRASTCTRSRRPRSTASAART